MNGSLEAFDIVIEELQLLRARLDIDTFDRAVALIRSSESHGGRVHVTGIGKSEHIARYAASLLSSTGTPAVFLHGTETVHGGAGQIVEGDVVVAISNSGETEETRAAVEAASRLGARILAVTGSENSWLGRSADVSLDSSVSREGGGLGFAPRASAAAQLTILASLSAALEEERDFSRADFNARHPAGQLGKRSSIK